MRKSNWGKFGLEFLSIFIAVLSAFALNNWNDYRKDANAENKILTEIANGLRKDIDDIRGNMKGHESGISACKYWRNVINNKAIDQDSISQNYLNLTRDFISIQNVSGYETLKSKGLELLKNDSLRTAIISIYEYDYNTLRKLEEEYNEMQFQENYFEAINSYIAPNLVYNEMGNIVKIDLPLKLSTSEKKILLAYLWKIQMNRRFILLYYSEIEQKASQLLASIEKSLTDR